MKKDTREVASADLELVLVDLQREVHSFKRMFKTFAILDLKPI